MIIWQWAVYCLHKISAKMTDLIPVKFLSLSRPFSSPVFLNIPSTGQMFGNLGISIFYWIYWTTNMSIFARPNFLLIFKPGPPWLSLIHFFLSFPWTALRFISPPKNLRKKKSLLALNCIQSWHSSPAYTIWKVGNYFTQEKGSDQKCVRKKL